MTEVEQYIKSFFGVVDTDELNKIGSLFKLTTIQRGDYFLKAGNVATN